MVRGYQHELRSSRFRVGTVATPLEEFGMHKQVGDDGVFAVRSSGLVTALTNASSPRSAAPAVDNDAAHNDMVRAYFLSAGLPADQIKDVQARQVVGTGGASSPDAPIVKTVQYRYTILTRQIGGVVVRDSFAWARMNADGSVVEEQVYWPPIPQSVVDDALALEARVREDARRAEFERRLPEHSHSPGVQIRHTPGEWDHDFVAAAVYEVVSKGDFPATLHFDGSARPFVFPHEQPGAWGPERPAAVKPRRNWAP
jgi:hypothetical protein